MRKRDEDKQQRSKEAVVGVILKEGINGASVSKIACEAGVSPATIYIYYENKDEMLAEVFREYSHKSYHYLMERMSPEMSGEELIESLVRGFFTYTVENEEAFSFVEQCSRCPGLAHTVCESECGCDVFDVIHHYQEMGIVRKCSDPNLSAVLFSPVRFLAMHAKTMDYDAGDDLNELIGMIQELLLI